MAGDPVARAENVWRRSYPLWDAYFAMVLAGTVAATAADEVPPGRRTAAIGLLLLLGAAYVAIGRKALRSPDVPRPGCKVYAAALICMFVPATLLAPVTATALAALAPQVYMMYGPGRGFALLLVLLSGPVGRGLAESGASTAMTVVIVAAGIACSVLLVVFIGRMGRQNHERMRLIEELDRTRGELAEVSREAGVLAERGAPPATSMTRSRRASPRSRCFCRLRRPNSGRTGTWNWPCGRPARTSPKPAASSRRWRPRTGRQLPGGGVAADGPRLRPAGRPRRRGRAAPLDAVEIVLLRVTQEALTNVRKHAGASKVRVSLDYGDPVRLTVADDGRGFAPDGVERGFGLRGMRSRVEQAEGDVHRHRHRRHRGRGGDPVLRVMIVDDHPIVREGLRGMLAAEPDIEVAGEAASGDEAVALVPRVAPDVVLMDLRMPSGDGVSAIERLPGHRILVLTTFQDDADIVRAIKAAPPATSSRTPPAPTSPPPSATSRQAAASYRPRSRPASPRSTRPRAARPVDAGVGGARPRRRGLTNAQIGERLYIGQATVKTHLLRIFTKLGVSDRTAAVMTALEHGILSVP